jgi:hypothetical protein
MRPAAALFGREAVSARKPKFEEHGLYFISIETVSSHLKHIYEKMRVRARAEAMARYMTSKKNVMR